MGDRHIMVGPLKGWLSRFGIRSKQSRPGVVSLHACGAHVGAVGGAEFYPLHDADLSGREVTMAN